MRVVQKMPRDGGLLLCNFRYISCLNGVCLLILTIHKRYLQITEIIATVLAIKKELAVI
jgi:hypothetical protein